MSNTTKKKTKTQIKNLIKSLETAHEDLLDYILDHPMSTPEKNRLCGFGIGELKRIQKGKRKIHLDRLREGARKLIERGKAE